ncbi:MAG TPA: DHHA1 domain-containing protein [Myxococcales bacterium]|nr:DHHA1 domain-containing protein [Myxococcales bacterium]
MTERLYLRDPYLTRFAARVVSVADLDGRPAAVLDRSAFYPEGGGQPADRGTLGGAAVVDVQERDGSVLHVLDRALQPGEVEGLVDWARRFDHMQQHHGQHLLSAAFERVLEAATTSFHLGERTCTIDLDCSVSRLDEAALRAVEAAANESVWRNLPVVARDFAAEERARLPLRKEPVKGDRVVLVEGVDASPCGGTHPARTGEVGAIAVLGAQKWGAGKARVEFVCGARVVRLVGEQGRWISGAAEALRCAQPELPEAARRAAAEAVSRRKAAEALEKEVARLQAVELASRGSPVVAKVERASLARAIATAVADRGATALIAAVEDGRAHLCFARPRGAGGPAMNQLLQTALQVIAGKGGGNADFAQGSGDPARLEEALGRAREML